MLSITTRSFKKIPPPVRLAFLVCLIGNLLTGCASDTALKAPCPNYGASCAKKPINSWDYQAV